MALYVHGNNTVYFESFGHIQQEVKKFMGNKNSITNIYVTQA